MARLEELEERVRAGVMERDVDVGALQEEHDRLRGELSAFDPQFFDEIEDLKFQYEQVKQQNSVLLEQVQRLSRRNV